MKKYVYIYCVIILLIIVLPILFVNKIEINNKEEIKNESEHIKERSKEITLKIANSNEVITMPIEEYIVHVVSAEMPATYEMEALKAQAIAARTYALEKMQYEQTEHAGIDVCDNVNHCQAYISKEDRLQKWDESNLDSNELWNKIEQAVYDTYGQVITYDGKLIKAFFHANSGGKTDNVEDVWGGNLDYLKAVETAGENNYSQYASNIEISKDEFINILKNRYTNFKIDFKDNDCIKILEYTEGDRIKKIKIGNIELSGVNVREMFKLKSAKFNITIKGNTVAFDVIGYGHGVGMSQTGSNELAKSGMTYEEILKHYYTNVELEKYY